jgi:Flp pilus assembly pilin Flp
MMLNLYCKLKALLATRDQGVTAAEYALILVAVIVTIGAIVAAFGTQIGVRFQQACVALGTAC